jgi:5-methylcytosine-specific restriction endonuclease McrA
MLTIELVPSTCWYSNLRSELTRAQWDKLRRASYKKANNRCEVCGGHGPKWPVECHEIWDFNDAEKIQTLRGLISLCPRCHEVKHIGLAGKRGRSQEAKSQLAKVNNWSKVQAQDYINESFEVWSERSNHEWTLDISWVEEHLV